MQHSDGSDAELVERARAGSAPAFAVLLHRHAPTVRTVVADDRDPTGAVVGTFVTAMRRLPKHPPDADPRAWLLELAAAEVRTPHPIGDLPPPELDQEELDEIWAELDLRWPDGRAPRSLPRWVSWSALVLALAALAVLMPYAVLTLGANGNDGPTELASLVARPFDEQIEEGALDEELEEDLEPPTFEFPDMQAEPNPEPLPDQ